MEMPTAQIVRDGLICLAGEALGSARCELLGSRKDPPKALALARVAIEHLETAIRMTEESEIKKP
jgi:hypothetical protein